MEGGTALAVGGTLPRCCRMSKNNAFIQKKRVGGAFSFTTEGFFYPNDGRKKDFMPNIFTYRDNPCRGGNGMCPEFET